ncbi:MFS transporter [Acidovorax sp. SRB_24]|uniref:MFS transporter n=1 Tax=Acidovorax sp. SRB_24 TaxID=1962700 RepID=UPI00145F3E58|nr:MFS transporter [Acidovorax sp. SRB_24]NMM76590.1 MFS transporter [Acidovorax sp. SRB_24]
MTSAATLSARQGLTYGLLGLPLAFVALPLYVLLPHHYASAFGMPLATLGALLLGARLFDAAIDPLLGRWSDRLFARSLRAVWAVGAVAALVLSLGLTGLFYPARTGPQALVVWALGCLLVTYTAFSQLSIAHQAWGARLGGDELQRGRIVAWREGCGLVGVVLASVLPGLFGLPAMLGVFAAALALGWLAWTRAPRPPAAAPHATHPGAAAASPWHPWRCAPFRRLLAVFMLSGIASAVPATLVLFFVQDRLRAAPTLEPLFLGSYFVCAALAMPLWLRAVAHWGLARTWLAGMLLSVAVFASVAGLGAGDSAAFVAVCALSGAALGADLALPGALLAGVIAGQGDSGRHEGAYFGWWNFATKLNLALAAGLALPLLGALGYSPGTRDPEALRTLGLAYAVLPCALKLLAAAALAFFFVRRSPRAPLLV